MGASTSSFPKEQNCWGYPELQYRQREGDDSSKIYTPRAEAVGKKDGEEEELTKRLETERGRKPTRGGWEAHPAQRHIGSSPGQSPPYLPPGTI